VTVVPEKAIFRSVTGNSKHLFSQCNLTSQIGQLQPTSAG